MRATVRVRMATDKGVAAGLAWDDMSDGVCQAATLSVAIRGQQNFRQAGHGIGFGVISATPLLNNRSKCTHVLSRNGLWKGLRVDLRREEQDSLTHTRSLK